MDKTDSDKNLEYEKLRAECEKLKAETDVLRKVTPVRENLKLIGSVMMIVIGVSALFVNTKYQELKKQEVISQAKVDLQNVQEKERLAEQNAKMADDQMRNAQEKERLAEQNAKMADDQIHRANESLAQTEASFKKTTKELRDAKNSLKLTNAKYVVRMARLKADIHNVVDSTKPESAEGLAIKGAKIQKKIDQYLEAAAQSVNNVSTVNSEVPTASSMCSQRIGPDVIRSARIGQQSGAVEVFGHDEVKLAAVISTLTQAGLQVIAPTSNGESVKVPKIEFQKNTQNRLMSSVKKRLKNCIGYADVDSVPRQKNMDFVVFLP